jgi:anoctamin-10
VLSEVSGIEKKANDQSIISWIGAITNAALIYLFRPTAELAAHPQTPNPNVPPYAGTSHLQTIINSYTSHTTLRTILPTLIPLALVALAASHGFLILKWVVEGVVERLVWRGSKEELEVQRLRAKTHGVEKKLEGLSKRSGGEGLRGGFWNGGEEGAREIGRVTKLN